MTKFHSRSETLALLPDTFFMTDEKRCPDPLAVVEGLPEGCGVIFRDYQNPERNKLAFSLARVCRKRGLFFLVAEDAALARKTGADGLHLPEWALRRHSGLMGLDKRSLITASAHSPFALKRAVTLGADAVLVGPAFQTESHPGYPGLGIHRLQRLVQRAQLPVYVVGGINERTLGRLAPMDALAGIAGISFFMK